MSKHARDGKLVIYLKGGKRGRARPFYAKPISKMVWGDEKMIELKHVTQPVRDVISKSKHKRLVCAARRGIKPYAIEIDCDCFMCQKSEHSNFHWHLVLANNPGLCEKLKEEQRIRDEIGACRAREAGWRTGMGRG